MTGIRGWLEAHKRIAVAGAAVVALASVIGAFALGHAAGATQPTATSPHASPCVPGRRARAVNSNRRVQGVGANSITLINAANKPVTFDLAPGLKVLDSSHHRLTLADLHPADYVSLRSSRPPSPAPGASPRRLVTQIVDYGSSPPPAPAPRGGGCPVG